MQANYKVLLVEPKKSMAYIYKSMLPWDKYQFEISAECDNETAGIAMYGEYYPDVVFCDVQLADGDGMSLIRKLKGLNPNCRIVVISNKTDFETVREAFLSGCYDFLKKSDLRFRTLENLLVRLRKDLDQSGEHSLKSWRKNLEYLLGLIRDRQAVDEEVLHDALRHPDLMLLQDPFQLIYFRLDNVFQVNHDMRRYDKLHFNKDENEQFLDKYRAKLQLRVELQKNAEEVVNKAFSDIPAHRLIFTKKHSGLIILPVMDRDVVHAKMKLLSHLLSEYCFYSYSVSLGLIYSGTRSFLQAYKDIMAAHEWKFYKGDGCILDALEVHDFQMICHNLDHYVQPLVNHVTSMRLQAALDVLDVMYNEIEKQGVYPPLVKDYMAGVLSKIEEYVQSKGISNPELFSMYKEGCKKCDSLVFMKSEMERIIKSIIQYLSEMHIHQYSKKVNDMVRFIEENLSEKITLSMIASFSHFSEIHASRLFKKEVGVGIVEYINMQKMNKAKVLLEESDMKIKDVAHAVGISDQLYFNKLFHKQFGMSPSDFRKQK